MHGEQFQAEEKVELDAVLSGPDVHYPDPDPGGDLEAESQDPGASHPDPGGGSASGAAACAGLQTDAAVERIVYRPGCAEFDRADNPFAVL